MLLRVVGCSGSVPGPGGPASCYLLSARDGAGRTWRVVLDLGSGAFGPLQQHAPPAELDALWLSHLHADHCLDATALHVALRHGPPSWSGAGRVAAGRPGRLPVWGPVGTGLRLARAHDVDPGAQDGLDGALDVRHWIVGQAVEVGPLVVTPFLLRHPVEAYGLRVEGPSEHGGRAVLAYTGDTDACPALLDLARDADLLLCEASTTEGERDVPGVHLSGARAGRAAAQAGARRLVLTHVPPWTDGAAVLAEAAVEHPGPLSLAAPGLVLAV